MCGNEWSSDFTNSTIGVGPRLTSLLVEVTEDGELKAEDVCRCVLVFTLVLACMLLHLVFFFDNMT